MKNTAGRSQDGEGIGQETTFSPTNSSKAHLDVEQLPQNNAGRGHQAPRKATHSLQKEVGQNRKKKKQKQKSATWGGSCEGGEVSTIGNPSMGLWGVLESQRAT